MNKEQLKDVVSSIALLGRGASKVRDELITAVDQLDEPQHKPVEVPTTIYDKIFWHEKLGHDKTYTIWSIMGGLEDNTYDFDTKEWIRSHDSELIDAVLYGCKPMKKQWAVKMKNAFFADFAESFLSNERKKEWDLADFNTIVKGEVAKAYKFTEKAKAEAVATLVGGKVEEL